MSQTETAPSPQPPPQHQDHRPGIESEMVPRSIASDPTY
jgi:hypothetical protein